MKILKYEIPEEGLLPEQFNKAVTDKLIEGLQKGELQFVLNQELTDKGCEVKSVAVIPI